MSNKFLVAASVAASLLLGTMNPVYAATDEKTVIAKVNGREITAGEVKKLEAALPPQITQQVKEEDKGKLFELLRSQLVDAALVTEAAKASGIEKKAEVQAAMAKASEQVVVQAFMAEKLKPAVNDKAIKEKYDQIVKSIPKDEMEVKARHILVKDEAAAKKLISQLKGGADFMKLARENSEDKATAKEGGDLGYFRRAQMVAEFADAAFNMKPGTYSDSPIKTQFGYHVIKVDDKRKVKPPKFEDVKDQLSALVMEEAMGKMVAELRKGAKIELFDTNGKPVSAPAAPATSPSSEAPKAQDVAATSSEPAAEVTQVAASEEMPQEEANAEEAEKASEAAAQKAKAKASNKQAKANKTKATTHKVAHKN
ncbi:MAG: peptidylprolyl isomerase [Holosporales bacterium]